MEVLFLHRYVIILKSRMNSYVKVAIIFFIEMVGCIVTINVLWLFLRVPWVGLPCVIVVFPDNTYLLFDMEQ